MYRLERAGSLIKSVFDDYNFCVTRKVWERSKEGENRHCLEASRARLLRRTIYRTEEEVPALLWMLLLEVVRGRQGEEGVRVLVQPRMVCVMRVEVKWQLNLRIQMRKARNSGRH